VCGCASVYVRVWVHVSESIDIAKTYIQLEVKFHQSYH